VATLVVAGYLLVSAGGGVVHSYRLASDEARLRQEVEALERQKDQLLQIRDYLRTDEYIEFMARRVFGLVKPGETLVVVNAPASEGAAKAAPDQTGLTWWQRLFGR
jgi:cell division protein FtsB